MVATNQTASSSTTREIPIVPLENGDRLHRPEFERRYTATPHVKKAELIEGTVYVASPLRFTPHAEPHGQLLTWLGVYQASTSACRLGIEPTVRLDNDNEPQPDIALFREGGSAAIDPDGYIAGAPELIVEIAASTTSYDLHDKKQAYERNGAKEYIVWRTLDGAIDWFIWQNGQYENLEPDEVGILKSREFPGLWLNASAVLSGDMAAVLRSLQDGLQARDAQL
ncbi:MAG: Uma2 family endonuclease [Geitlerinemataceae cyanobacterium]